MPEIGQKLGRYRIEEEIGAGGHGRGLSRL